MATRPDTDYYFFFNILFAIVIVIQSKDITEGNVLKVYVCKTVIHAAVANEAC